MKLRLMAVLTAGLLGLGSVGLALLPAPAPAFAASGSCGAGGGATGHAIEGWAWAPPANGVPGEVTFTSVTGEEVSIGPYPASINQVDQNWKEIDDVAPLLWGYKFGVTGIIGDINELFTSCQQWTLGAAQVMADQHFSPTMIGGVMGPVIGPNGNVVPDPVTGGSGTGSTGSGSTTVNVTITVNPAPVNYYVNGALATPAGGQFDNQGVVKVSDSLVYNKTTYVPIRFAAELLGQPVAWNASQHGVDLTVNSSLAPAPSSTTRLRVPVRATTERITVNEAPVQFYVGASDRTPAGGKFNNQGVVVPDGFIYNQTTYIPIRLAADMLGQTIQWDSKHYSVDIGSPPTSANIRPTTKTTGAVASATALSYPSVVTNPPAGSASRAAQGIKQDDKLFASGGGSTTTSKPSPLKAIVAVLILVALVIGLVLFVRWRRERAIYSTKNMRRLM